MKKLSFVSLSTLALAACQDATTLPHSPAPQSASATVSPSKAPAPIADEYIVVFREDVADVAGTAGQLAAANGATIRFTYRHALKGFAAHMSGAAAEALTHNPRVAFVEQDQVVSLNDVETMDVNGDPWGLDRIDAATGLNQSYSYSLTGTNVTAYIIDTGILTTHNEFGGRAESGYTSIPDGNGTTDCNGHGTHVSGTVGGTTYGVAKNVHLVAVRVLDCSGSGSNSGVVAGVDWVTANHISPAVANMSLGGSASAALDLAVTNSINSGVSYAIAAGNGNALGIAQDACNYSPARVPAAMTIGATTKTDAKTSWSNYGSCVDWFAPGSGIKSSWIGSSSATNTISGTSMATPHVTGVAALYLQANPGATPQQVRDGLYAAATKGIVTSASTANNHLLYTPPAGFGAPTNSLPKAAFTYSCTSLSCAFTDKSTDSDGQVSGWSWKFGDGAASTEQSPAHTFSSAGSYNVELTVTDNLGGQNITTQSVAVSAPSSGSPATLSVSASKVKSQWTAVLQWSGFAAGVTQVDVFRSNVRIGSGAGPSGSYTDSGKGGGTFVYKVCEVNNSANCTNQVTASP